MRSDLESNQAFDQHIKSGRFSHSRKVLSGDVLLTTNGALVNFLDANGLTRIITLPTLEDGRFYVVSNVGAANNLEVRSGTGALITTLLPRDSALLFASNAEWVALRGWAALGVFTNTVNGLVPAPNSSVPGSLFLRDDGQWAQVQVTGIVDAFKFITDGTTIAIGSGPDTFRLRSSTNKVGIVVQNNDATFGDNANFTVNEANVDHNSLLNYVADQHVAHSGVTLTAGVGLAGGGTIAASRTFDLDLNDLTVDVPVLADSFAFYDASGLDTNKATLTTLNGILDHNALLNYVASRHVDHTGVSIIAGAGLAGGGDITTSRTLALDINGLVADTLAVGDFFAFYDISGVDHNKVTLANLNASLDHNTLLNYVANQHIDHTSVSIATTEGVQGGGTIAATRTLKLDINGLTVDSAPDPVADYLVTFDASAATHKKVLPTSLHRATLTANRTYYVRTDGSDSNTGLANTAGGAFLTIQKAIDSACALDLSIYAVTISVADGSYPAQHTLKPYIGLGPISIVGNTTTPANVFISSGAPFAYNGGPRWQLQGMKLQTTGIAINVISGQVDYGFIDFGTATNYHVNVDGQGYVRVIGNCTISGAAVIHMVCSRGSAIDARGYTYTFTTNPTNFSNSFINAGLAGTVQINGSTFTNIGYVTGPRYYVDRNAVVDAGGAGATYLPGTVAGTAATGGQYT